jgi:hypothetical protein
MARQHAGETEGCFTSAPLQFKFDFADWQLPPVMLDLAAVKRDLDQRAVIFDLERGAIDHRSKQRP